MNRKWKFPPQIAEHSGEKNVPPGRLSFSEILNDLSKELAFNHLANSFADEFIEKDKQKDRLEKIFKEVLLDNTRERPVPDFEEISLTRRNIVVLGAGVTYDSYRCIPLGSGVIDFLEDKYIKGEDGLNKLAFLKEKQERERENIRELSGVGIDFENFLYMLQNFFVNGDTLRKDIDELIGFRYSPCLFYEIIAHLLKHHFIDVVINFNFEEMLDHAIEQEIGKDNYHFVLSDGHSVNLEDLIVEERIKRPVYIKPHGTYSHKSSLRFTKQHYLDMPEDITEMLKKILGGTRGKKKKRDIKVDRVNIICVGFDLASIEFNRILNKELPNTSRIYHFLGSNPYEKRKNEDKALVERLEERLNGFLSRVNSKGLQRDLLEGIYHPIWVLDRKIEKLSNDKKNHVSSPLAEIFSMLWRKTHGIFKNGYGPRSIARHELISYLFYDAKRHLRNAEEKSDSFMRKELRIYETSSEYFSDRLLVEIAISLIRNNGVVDIALALKGRIGKLFAKYQEACGREKSRKILTIYDFFSSFLWVDRNSPIDVYRRFVFHLNSMTFWGNFKKNGLEDLEGGMEKLIGLVRSDFLSLLNERTDEFINCLTDNCKIYYKKRDNPFPVFVVLLLLGNRNLSKNFKIRFLSVYDKRVYNGLVDETNVLQEVLRISCKSNSSNFFHIANDLKGTKQKIWESFRSKDLIGTNLTLLYHYKTSYNRKDWNCLLTLVEGGEIIREIFAGYGAFEEKRKIEEDIVNSYKKKKVFLLMSFETVLAYQMAHSSSFREKYHNIKNNEKSAAEIYELLITEHRKFLFGNYLEEVENSFFIFLMPVQEHNNHTTMFLNTDEGPEPKINVGRGDFRVKDAYHLYRKGYSNSINPIRLNLENDQGKTNRIQRGRRDRDIEKHTSFFFMNLCRAVSYEIRLGSTSYKKMLNGELEGSEIDFQSWMVWEPSEFEKMKSSFLRKLYDVCKHESL